jgi:hypothetical protein
MKIRCKINKLSDIRDKSVLDYLRKYIHLDNDEELHLRVGQVYHVYGIVFWDGCPWYYICEEDSDSFPKPKSAEFFEVVDDRLSAYWILEHNHNSKGKCCSSLVFREWASNESFYEQLIDESSLEVETFNKYRKLIDNESNGDSI